MHPAFSAYLDHLAAVQKSPLTIRRYHDVLEELDRVARREKVEATNLPRPALQRFASLPRRDGSPRSPAGTNLRVAVLKATFTWLAQEQLAPGNPAAALVGIPEPRRVPKYLTTAEVHRLLDHVAGEGGGLALRNVAIVVAFWQTGLRVREVARLQVGQLDCERRVLRDVLVKGGHLRDVALNDETLAVLDRYLACREELAGDASLFARQGGGPLSVRAIQSLFAGWRRDLGWTRPLHPHVLRHTHATGALAEGVGIETVAALLGHHGLRSVLVYASVQDGARRAALAKLGRLVPKRLLSEPPRALTRDLPPANENGCVEEPFHALGEAA